MGNCQAAEAAATVVIQHPNGNLQTLHSSLSANHLMAANPGHYVALIISTTKTTTTSSSSPHNNIPQKNPAATMTVKHMKLLRPDDTLRLGYAYRLVSFDEVVKEFATKKRAKLRWLLENDDEEKSRPKRENNGSSKAAKVSRDQPARQNDQNQQESEAKLDAELEELVNGMTLADKTKTTQAGGHVNATITRHSQWKPALQSISEVGC